MKKVKEEISDREAVAACLQGNTQMYRHIVDRYKERAYYLALMYTKNREDALDLSQEAFYRAYRALKDFDASRPFYSWFYRILKNLCINFVNHRKRLVRLDDTFQYEASNPEDHPEEIFERNERAEMVWKGLNELNEKDREIIIMKDFNDFSYQEIAEALNIPIGSVMSRLYYARKRLMSKIDEMSGGL